MAFRGTFSSIKKRVALSDIGKEDPKYRGRLYSFIRVFLAISIVSFVIEIITYFQKWDLKMIHSWEVLGLVHWSYMAWLSFRVDYVAPVIIMLSKFCIVLFMIQLVDRLALGIGCFWIKYKKLKPVRKGEAYDIEDCSSFLMVLVQIPMCNEKEVFATSISTAACQLDWPKDRFLIKVLDDSDDELLQLLIRNEVSLWKENVREYNNRDAKFYGNILAKMNKLEHVKSAAKQESMYPRHGCQTPLYQMQKVIQGLSNLEYYPELEQHASIPQKQQTTESYSTPWDRLVFPWA